MCVLHGQKMNRTHVIFCSVSLGYRKKVLKILVVGQLRTPGKQKKKTLYSLELGVPSKDRWLGCSFILLKLEIREFSGVVLRLNFWWHVEVLKVNFSLSGQILLLFYNTLLLKLPMKTLGDYQNLWEVSAAFWNKTLYTYYKLQQANLCWTVVLLLWISSEHN